MASTSYLSTMSTSGMALTLGAGRPAVAAELLRSGLERDRAELAAQERLLALAPRDSYRRSLVEAMRAGVARSESVLANVEAVA